MGDMLRIAFMNWLNVEKDTAQPHFVEEEETMRINFIIFTIIIERSDLRKIDQSIQRKRLIEEKMNEIKYKYYL